MNRENLDFLYKMFPHHQLEDLKVLIVNQTTKDKILTSAIKTVEVINSFEKGLSKSRNLALKNATADWCLIADDDLVYLEDFEYSITSGITKFENAGIINFQVRNNQNNLSKKYPNQSKSNISIFEELNVGSAEMLIHIKKIKGKVIFNKWFGLGSGVFGSGEEQVFINDVKQKLNLPISFYKKNIVEHIGVSTGNDFTREERYFTKGGVYAKIFSNNYLMWIIKQLFFDLKQRKSSIFQVLTNYKEAMQGVRKLKCLNNEK